MSDYDHFDRLVDSDTLRLRDEARQMADWLGWVVECNDVECRYDHDDVCQAHYLDPKPCPMERITAYLQEAAS